MVLIKWLCLQYRFFQNRYGTLYSKNEEMINPNVSRDHYKRLSAKVSIFLNGYKFSLNDQVALKEIQRDK